jgi:lysozyme
MNLSQNGINNLKEWEGCEKNVYLDSAGLPTIGVGHLLTRDELTSGKINILGVPYKYKEGLNDDQINRLLSHDAAFAKSAVNQGIKVPLTQNQYDVLVSFCFNVGRQAFLNSTLRKRINAGNFDDVPNQLKRWNRSGGKVVQGLINRREKEIDLWNS